MQKIVCAALWLAFLFGYAGAAVPRDSTYASSSGMTLPSDNTETVKEFTAEDIVITAARIETPSGEVGSSISVITHAQMETKHISTVLEALRMSPALDVVQSSGPGSETSVFIRGAKSEHTLVLVDGMEVNDPISAGRSFDFANLTTDNIERIEVLCGPQSTLYGSDAMGGVINIITRSGSETTGGAVSITAGAMNTFRETAHINKGGRRAGFSLGFSRWDTEGISAAGERGSRHEKDGYGNTTISGKLDFHPAARVDVDVIAQYADTRTDLDNSGGAAGDDPNNTADSEHLLFITRARHASFNNAWTQQAGFSLSNHDRRYRNDPDEAHPVDSDHSTYTGRMFKFDWQHTLALHETNSLTLGAETEMEQGKSDYTSVSAWGPYTSTFKNETARTTGYYLQDQIKLWNSWFTTLGVRRDHHDKIGSKATYRVVSSYLLQHTGTRIKGTYGTGFKAPSLYQLYSPYGDQRLTPEVSTGWDAGIEQSVMNRRLTLGAAVFRNTFDSIIDYDSGTSKFVNIGEAETQGLELTASARLRGNLALQAGYTFTDTEDTATGKPLLRRAKHKLGCDVSAGFLQKGTVNVDVRYTGARADNDFSIWPAVPVQLDGYALVNLAVSYHYTRNIQLFGRVENLLNASYEEVQGYGTPGFSVFEGIKVLF